LTDIENFYDEFFGTGLWEEQYKPHIVAFANRCIEMKEHSIKNITRLSQENKKKCSMKPCCYKNLDTPKRMGRAHYHCPECDTDVSLAHAVFMQANIESNKS
jgi:hypothetical protein